MKENFPTFLGATIAGLMTLAVILVFGDLGVAAWAGFMVGFLLGPSSKSILKEESK